jgi:hypothetical protein
MKIRSFPFLIVLALMGQPLFAQDQDLANLLEQNDKPVTQYTTATFKATRVVIGQSVETTPQGTLQFIISHHFGLINSGYQNLFGLNQAFIRIGSEYGITDWIAVGAGLNTFKLTWDGYAKVKILRQSTGAKRMPFTLTGFASMAVNTQKWAYPDRTNYSSSRYSYAFELILGRKFNKWLSLELNPVMVHRNLVATAKDHNDVYALGAGGRVKVSNRVSLNGEYFYVFPGQVDESGTRPDIHNSASFGVDIETGGHVFQIFLTNSQGVIEEYFVPETTGNWMKGDIFLGFNISRMLTIRPNKLD